MGSSQWLSKATQKKTINRRVPREGVILWGSVPASFVTQMEPWQAVGRPGQDGGLLSTKLSMGLPRQLEASRKLTAEGLK